MLKFLVLILLASSSATETKRVVCNFFSFAQYRSGEYAFNVTDIPVSICTHVVYDFIAVYYNSSVKGSLKFTDHGRHDWTDSWEDFCTLKQSNPELKLLISLNSPLLPEIACNPPQRKELVEKLTTFMDRHKMDGIELYWDRRYWIRLNQVFYLLLEELKTSFRAADLPTTELIASVELDCPIVDHARLCGLVDFVHVIEVTIRKSKYFDIKMMSSANRVDIDDQKNITLERALQHYWIDNGCPAEKIVLGVDFAAQFFNLFLRPFAFYLREMCPGTKKRPCCSYLDICQKFSESGWTLGWDDAEGWKPHAIKDEWRVAYENEASVGRKGMLAKENGLAGVYAFTLDLDDYRGKCGPMYPLLNALRSSFLQEIEDS